MKNGFIKNIEVINDLSNIDKYYYYSNHNKIYYHEFQTWSGIVRMIDYKIFGFRTVKKYK